MPIKPSSHLRQGGERMVKLHDGYMPWNNRTVGTRPAPGASSTHPAILESSPAQADDHWPGPAGHMRVDRPRSPPACRRLHSDGALGDDLGPIHRRVRL